jgi:hypothetical protein
MDLSGTILFDLLFHKTLAGYLCFAGLGALMYILFGKNPVTKSYAALGLWIAAWTMYDIFGYDYVVLTNGQFQSAVSVHKNLLHHYQVSLNAYRIIQMTFQWILTFLVVFAVGWKVGLAANLVWWGANCDVLYYFATWKSLPYEWTWLGWTPFGIFANSLSLPIVLLQAIGGLVAAALVMRRHVATLRQTDNANRLSAGNMDGRVR